MCLASEPDPLPPPPPAPPAAATATSPLDVATGDERRGAGESESVRRRATGRDALKVDLATSGATATGVNIPTI